MRTRRVCLCQRGGALEHGAGHSPKKSVGKRKRAQEKKKNKTRYEKKKEFNPKSHRRQTAKVGRDIRGRCASHKRGPSRTHAGESGGPMCQNLPTGGEGRGHRALGCMGGIGFTRVREGTKKVMRGSGLYRGGTPDATRPR